MVNAVTRPFRLKAPVPLERDTHIAVARLLDALLLRPAEWCSYPAGASTLSPQQAARHSEIGVKRGMPDIWVFYGAVYCIELKRPGTGALSKTRVARTKRGAPRILVGQAEMFPRLLASGAVKEIAICRSVDEVLHQLAQWHIPMRTHRQAALRFTMSTTTVPSPSSSTATTTPRRSVRSSSSATR